MTMPHLMNCLQTAPGLGAAESALPGLRAHYLLCSNSYGDCLDVPPGISFDEEFLDAVERGYEDAVLHDCGMLVVEKATGKLCFLVVVALNKGTTLTAEQVQDLSSASGLNVKLFEMEASGPGYPAYTVVAAQVDKVADFGLVQPLASAVFQLQGA